jgi:hypothetical protein
MVNSSCSTSGTRRVYLVSIATFLNAEMKQQKERISSQTSFLSHFFIFRKCNISIYATNVISGFMLVPKLLVFNVRICLFVCFLLTVVECTASAYSF